MFIPLILKKILKQTKNWSCHWNSIEIFLNKEKNSKCIRLSLCIGLVLFADGLSENWVVFHWIYWGVSISLKWKYKEFFWIHFTFGIEIKSLHKSWKLIEFGKTDQFWRLYAQTFWSDRSNFYEFSERILSLFLLQIWV